MKFLLILALLLAAVSAQSSIYDQYYQEALKIAQSMTIDQKIGQTIQADFQAITKDDKQSTDPQQAVDLALGSLLINGNAAPTTDGNLAKIPSQLEVQKVKDAYMKQTTQNWKKLIDRFKDLGVSVTTKEGKKYKVKFLFGTDAVHGDQHVLGNILWPHNIGLSCSHNEKHFQNMGFWTKTSLKKTGFNYAFAPTVAVSHNPQWGRFYQSMGQEDPYIYKYGQSFVKGIQDIQNGKINGVLTSVKHFFGDGSTLYGANQGTSHVLSFKNYISHNTQGYYGAAKSDVGSVMVSYSGVNYVPNSFNSLFLSSLLRQDIGFKGFTISDYNDIEKSQKMLLPRTFFNLTEQQGWATMINGGTDMIMISGYHNVIQNQVDRIIKEAKKAITKQMVLQQRLDESVARILAVKMSMGLVQKISGQQQVAQQKKQEQLTSSAPLTSSGNQYQDSLSAVHQSLVLLKNSNTLPIKNLKTNIQYVVLVGETIHNLNRLTRIQLFRNFDNIGMQSGGWSVRWQGFEGNDFWTDLNKNTSNATSLLDALKSLQKVNNFELIYPQYSSLTNQVSIDYERRSFQEQLKNKRKNMTSRNTIIIGVFGQFPYAESVGDVNIPYCRVDGQPGCLYDPLVNPYAPTAQKRTLKVEFSSFESNIIDIVKGADKTIPLVSVLLSGRPMLIDDILEPSAAFIAAWLPGTSGGQGILNAITGDYLIRPNGTSSRINTLSVDWPRGMDSLQRFPIYDVDGQVPKISDPQFQVGYGLSTANPTQKSESTSQSSKLITSQ